jgi:hypothetical protein
MLVAVRKQGARPHSAESRSATCPTQRGREFCAFVRAAVTPLAPSVAGTAQMRPCRPDCRSAPGAAVSLSERRLSLSAPVLAAERLVASAPGGRASGELRDATRPHTRYLRRGGRGVESQRRSAPLATRVSPVCTPVGAPRHLSRPDRIDDGAVRENRQLGAWTLSLSRAVGLGEDRFQAKQQRGSRSCSVPNAVRLSCHRMVRRSGMPRHRRPRPGFRCGPFQVTSGAPGNPGRPDADQLVLGGDDHA